MTDNTKTAFPFFNKSKLDSGAFITLTNEDPENEIERYDLNKFREKVLGDNLDNFDQAYLQAYGEDENFNAFLDHTIEVRKKAENFLQLIKTEYPNRYFILKRITQNPEFWELCLHDNFLLINDENYIQKLQNSNEVMFFF
jgi:hypothetical protein